MYKLTSYNIVNDVENNKLLIFNSLSKAVIKIEKKILEDILNMNPCEQSVKNFLLKGYFICKQDEDEKNLFSYVYKKLNTETEKIGITLVPSRLCNLRCTYCIQNNLFENKKNLFMTTDIIDKYYEWLLRYIKKSNTKSVGFNFYGGEPLLADNSVLFYLIKKMNDLPVKTQFIMVTNGTRLMQHPDIISFIDSYRITIDGLPEIHDKRRIYADGTGSYAQIIDNIRSYIQTYKKKNISIRINVDKSNRYFLKQAVDRILSDIGTKDLEFRLFPVVPNELDVEYGDIHGDLKETANCMYDCYVYLKEKYSIKPFIFSTNCGVSSFGRWVFDSNGSLHKCCSLIGHEDKKIGSLYSPIFTENYYLNLNRVYDEECQVCPYVCYCGGGCKMMEETHGQKQCLKEFHKVYIPRMIKLMYEK